MFINKEEDYLRATFSMIGQSLPYGIEFKMKQGFRYKGNTSTYWDAKLLNENIPNAAAVPLNGLFVPVSNSINNSVKDK